MRVTKPILLLECGTGAAALGQAIKRRKDAAVPLCKLLVFGRADRGGLAANRERIDALIREADFDGFFTTSAREGRQIPELLAAIRTAIDWDALPQVSSTELFQAIKGFLVDEKEKGRLLATASELYKAFKRVRPALAKHDIQAEFQTCIGLVESRDLIRRLNFGDYVLLQPELLDAYASAIIEAAKSEPDGLGCIAEQAALASELAMSADERLEDRALEKLVLIRTIEELSVYELALKEPGEHGIDLVFPSEFTRERPAAPDVLGRAIVLTFEGAVRSVYASLAVRLSHSRLFAKEQMWRDAASFRASVGGICGISLREMEGRGELTLFFDDRAGEAPRYQFEDFVQVHLERRAIPGSVSRRRIFACPECRVELSEPQVDTRRARGHTTMRCPVCEDVEISLLDREERLSAAVREMDRNADARRDLDVAAIVLKGKIETRDFDVLLCHNSRDKPEAKAVGERLIPTLRCFDSPQL